MKGAMIVGILLIVVGIVSLAFGGITYTTREEVLDIGPIEATAETEERIPLPPVLGGMAMVAGVAIVVLARRG